jgi:cytoskeletal protein RodZ
LKIGRILKETRIKKGITLSEASKALLIQEDYLEAIEDGMDDRLPAGVYKLIYTRSYCAYLGVEYREEKVKKSPEQDDIEKDRESEKTETQSTEPLELDFPIDINRTFRIGVKIIVSIVIVYILVKFFQLIF